MKILFIASGITGLQPGVSGSESRFIEIARHWQREGHEIHLLSSSGGKYLCDRLGLPVTLHAFPETRWKGRLAHAARLFQVVFHLPPSVLKESFDVIYSTSEGSYDVIPAWRIRKQSPKACWAVAVHWLPPFPPWKRTGSSVWNSTAFFITERMGLRLALRHADRILPVSEDTGKQLAAIGVPRQRYSPVECGVDLAKIQQAASPVKEKKVDAVFMKRLQTVKGIFDLVDIWEEVVKKKPDAKLWIIGEGLEENELRERIRQRGMEKNMELLGVIYDFGEKFSRLASAKLFLLPSHEENWAIVIGEAMAAGVPVICYDLPELRSVWKESCIFIPKHDTRAFAAEILKLIDDPAQLEKWRRTGADYVARFDWEGIARKEWQILQSSQG